MNDFPLNDDTLLRVICSNIRPTINIFYGEFVLAAKIVTAAFPLASVCWACLRSGA